MRSQPQTPPHTDVHEMSNRLLINPHMVATGPQPWSWSNPCPSHFSVISAQIIPDTPNQIINSPSRVEVDVLKQEKQQNVQDRWYSRTKVRKLN